MAEDQAAPGDHLVTQRAVDPGAFVDPDGTIPRPFVPSDDVEGRIERIFWPPSRFWLPVQ